MKKYNFSNTTARIMAIFLFLLFSSCRKLVTVPAPDNMITGEKVFENDQTALSAVSAIYGEMMNGPSLFSSSGLSLFGGLCADELYFYTPSFRDEFQKNEITLSSHAHIDNNFWIPAYRFLYAANSCIQGIERSAGMSSDAKKVLLAEAKLLRGFFHFYLVNLFGDVPLVVSPDYYINAFMPRKDQLLVYDQIIRDLMDAFEQLPEAYSSTDRNRPNKWAAAGLLARVHLYRGNWTAAESFASLVIQSGAYVLGSNLGQVFLKTSKETLWQLQPVAAGQNTQEGGQIIPATASTVPTFLLTPGFINSFTAGDLRKTNWTNSRVYAGQTLHYPYKYKVASNNQPVTEHYIVQRLAEIYLIRAEARAHLQNLPGSLSDLNIIRSRAGLTPSSASTADELLAETALQRKFELFTEWGHRWFDLKRTGKAATVLGALKPATWQLTDLWWPLPSSQLLVNPSLVQNPGY